MFDIPFSYAGSHKETMAFKFEDTILTVFTMIAFEWLINVTFITVMGNFR
jgi:hypothetical protein